MGRLFPLNDSRERLNTLRRLTAFRSCTNAELRAVEGLMTRIDIPAGRLLCEEGERAYEVIFIVDGIAKVERNGEQIALLGPGEVVGEMAMLDRGTRNATVTAATPMRIFVLDSREFAGVLDAAPCARDWIEDVAARRREANTNAA